MAKASADPKLREHNRGSKHFYRLGVFDPGKPDEPILYYRRSFADSPLGRQIMARAISVFNDLAASTPGDYRCIGAFRFRRKVTRA